MTRTERLARIGEHAQKWVRLEAEKAEARRVNALAWEVMQILDADGAGVVSAVWG